MLENNKDNRQKTTTKFNNVAYLLWSTYRRSTNYQMKNYQNQQYLGLKFWEGSCSWWNPSITASCHAATGMCPS